VKINEVTIFGSSPDKWLKNGVQLYFKIAGSTFIPNIITVNADIH